MTKDEKTKRKKHPVREFIETLLSAILIALVVRSVFIDNFKIPTGSMEKSLLIGDHIMCNKFVYGIRTPGWIGIPDSKIGFRIPFTRTPGIRKPKQGEVVIFKYPRDDMKNYVKRCIAVSGDTVLIRNRMTYVNGVLFPDPPHAQFIGGRILPADYNQPDIFPPGAGNIHQYGPVRIPAPGDTFIFTESNRDKWFERFQLMVYEGNKLFLKNGGKVYDLTIPNIDQWQRLIRQYSIDRFYLNGQPLKTSGYTVKYDHYFMMGDNRDNSLDSRFWGFVPGRHIIGEGIIIWWSWEKRLPLYRIFQKIRWNRLLKLIH